MILRLVLVCALVSISAISHDQGPLNGSGLRNCVCYGRKEISHNEIPVKGFGRRKCDCRKTNGRRTTVSSRDGMAFPYMASLRYNGKHDCGGSILNKRWILTSAWCLTNVSLSDLTIAVGSIYRDDPKARVYKVLKYEKHKNYDKPRRANDIGLIKLTRDIEFSGYLKPIIFYTEYIGGGVNLTAIGWGQYKFENEGYVDILKIMPVMSITHKECKKVTGWLVRIYPTMLCAIANSIAPGHYWGDTGGPLVYKEKVAGIASFFYDGSNATLPDGFTRVSSYVDWIWERINK